MSSTDGENQPDNTHLDERCSGITEPFVMQPNPNMDYNVLTLKECPKCKEQFDISEMEADHIIPWHEGGKTIEENCQLLCKTDNRKKSGK